MLALFFPLLLRSSRSPAEAGVPLLRAWFFPLPSLPSGGSGPALPSLGGVWRLVSAAPGQGEFHWGDFTSSWLPRLWREAQCGPRRPLPPTRLGPASLGGPCCPQTHQLLQRGHALIRENPAAQEQPPARPVPPCPLCHRSCGSLSCPEASGPSLHTRDSGPGLPSPPRGCPLPSNNPWTPTSRSPSPPGPPCLVPVTVGLATWLPGPCGVFVLWGPLEEVF